MFWACFDIWPRNDLGVDLCRSVLEIGPKTEMFEIVFWIYRDIGPKIRFSELIQRAEFFFGPIEIHFNIKE